MHRAILLALLTLLLLRPIETSGSQGDTDEAAFLVGWKTGQADMHEAKILEAFVTIQLLQGLDGSRIPRIVGLKRKQINNDLLSLSRYLDEMAEVREWPEEVCATALIKSVNMKKAFQRLRQARREGAWEETNPENEKAIQRVFAVYDEFGNPLRVDANEFPSAD